MIIDCDYGRIMRAAAKEVRQTARSSRFYDWIARGGKVDLNGLPEISPMRMPRKQPIVVWDANEASLWDTSSAEDPRGPGVYGA